MRVQPALSPRPLGERSPRLLSVFPGVPDLPRDALALAHQRECAPASHLVRSSSALSSSKRDPRLALAYPTRRYASSPAAMMEMTPRVRLGQAPTPRGRLHTASSLSEGSQQSRLSAMPMGVSQSRGAHSKAPMRLKSSCSIPSRHSARFALPDSIGPTAHTAPLHPPQIEHSGAAMARRGSHNHPAPFRSSQLAHRSKSTSPRRMERLALSATMPPMRSPGALNLSKADLSLSLTGETSPGTMSRSISLLALNRMPKAEVREAARIESDAIGTRAPLCAQA